MFLKKIYNNLFSIDSYLSTAKEKLWKNIVFILILSILSSVCYSLIGYMKIKPVMENEINRLYELVPDFTLSKDGFNIESKEPIKFSLAGRNFLIDSNRTLTEMVVAEIIDKNTEVLFIANDGYGIVNGNILKSGNFFEDIPVLKTVEINKDDVEMIYQVIKIGLSDVVILALICVSFVMIALIFLRSFVYALALKMMVNVFGKKLKYKDAYNIMLNSHTFYIIYIGIAIFAAMNIPMFYRLIVIESSILLYMVLISLKFKSKKEN